MEKRLEEPSCHSPRNDCGPPQSLLEVDDTFSDTSEGPQRGEGVQVKVTTSRSLDAV